MSRRFATTVALAGALIGGAGLLGGCETRPCLRHQIVYDSVPVCQRYSDTGWCAFTTYQSRSRRICAEYAPEPPSASDLRPLPHRTTVAAAPAAPTASAAPTTRTASAPASRQAAAPARPVAPAPAGQAAMDSQRRAYAEQRLNALARAQAADDARDNALRAVAKRPWWRDPAEPADPAACQAARGLWWEGDGDGDGDIGFCSGYRIRDLSGEECKSLAAAHRNVRATASACLNAQSPWAPAASRLMPPRLAASGR